MKKIIALGLLALTAACASQPQETYPYGMNEKEWNELSIKDKANIRREYYFYEKGSTAFINPQMEVEGKKQEMPLLMQQQSQRRTKAVAKPVIVDED